MEYQIAILISKVKKIIFYDIELLMTATSEYWYEMSFNWDIMNTFNTGTGRMQMYHRTRVGVII